MTALVVDDVTVRFGGHLALDRVSLHAPGCCITGLIGPNGAGKTTMFNVCSGYQGHESGTVALNGDNITTLSAASRARAGLGRTFQRMQLFGSMTVRENVELAAESLSMTSEPLAMFGLRRSGRQRRTSVRTDAADLLATVGLTDLAGVEAGRLSTGEGRLLELARALARSPEVLLLDEPSSGLDAAETRRFGAILRDVARDRGTGILLVEHDMSLVLDICEYLFVLDFGKPLFEGTAAEVSRSALVREAYLGRQVDDVADPPDSELPARSSNDPTPTRRRTRPASTPTGEPR